MQKYADVVQKKNGDAVSGASVLVTTAAGATATIYSDNGVTTQANPITTDSLGGFSFYAADGRYNLTISGASLSASVTRADVLLEDDAQSDLLAWAYVQAFRLVSATRNSDGAITSASIVWPDGTTGTFTADTLSTDFPGAIDAWHATYVGTTTQTITQPAVTRNADGAVTAQPAITIA